MVKVLAVAVLQSDPINSTVAWNYLESKWICH